jgi:hypothetical protein
MPDSTTKDRSASAAGLGGMLLNQQRRRAYRVVLESINGDVETPESFAIKLSILLKIPVTKIKYMLRELPAPIWTGGAQTKARHLLALIEEAGGNAKIVEGEAQPEGSFETGGKGGRKPVCASCGFPLKKGNKFCGFCMTPVNPIEHHDTPITHIAVTDTVSIPLPRFIFYIALVVAIIIIALVAR